MCHHLLVPFFRVAGSCSRGAALLVSLLLAGSVTAQQPAAKPDAPPQQPVFRAGVSLVRVDVTVTGRDSVPVVGLGPSDFEVLEDGVPQVIEQVNFVSLSGEPAPGDDMSLAIRSREHAEAEAGREDVRLFALFLDDYHIERTPTSTVRLRETLSGFIRKEIKPLDLVATMDPLTPLSALEFTREKESLLRTIRKFEGRRGIYMPPRSVLEEEQLQSRDVARVRSEVTLSALEALVVKLSALREGRKSVIFVSEGPPLFFRDGAIEDLADGVLRAAHRGNVTINVLDPRGLTVGASNRGNDVLFRLAGETGGRTIVNTNNWEGGLAGVVRDASAYYLLTYSPTREWADGRFHRIDVKVKRPGARTVSRKGYWAPRAGDMALPVAPEMPGDVTEAKVALAESSRPGRPQLWLGLVWAGGRARVHASWELADSSEEGADRPAALALSLRDPADVEVAEVRIPASGDAGPWEGWMDVPAGSFTLAATVENAAGDVLDQWRRPWQVPPRQSEPALFTPRVVVARTPQALRRALAAEPSPPSAVREFRRNERVLVEFDMAWTGEPPGVEVTLLTSGGDRLARLETEERGRTTWRFEVPVGSLAVGEYSVRVEARRGEWVASEVIAFRLRPF